MENFYCFKRSPSDYFNLLNHEFEPSFCEDDSLSGLWENSIEQSLEPLSAFEDFDLSFDDDDEDDEDEDDDVEQ